MERINTFVNDLNLFTLQITQDGVGVTGQTPTISIKRGGGSPDFYWNDGTWDSSPHLIAMVEFDATNFPGLYTYSFTIPTALADDYLVVRFNNTGAYALDDYNFVSIRKYDFDKAPTTRSSVSPAAATYGERFEEIHGMVAGKMQMSNGGAGGAIQIDIYNYAETDIIKSNTVCKPNGTNNTQTLDANAMAGRESA